MLFMLLLVLATLWLPQPATFSPWAVLPLLVVVAVSWLATLVRRLQPALNRFSGILILAQVYALVSFTGGEQSIFAPLYLLLLIYGALFYDATRLAFTFVLVSSAALLPWAYASGFDTATLSRQVVLLATWGVAVVVVHALVEQLRRGATTDGLTGLANHATFWRLIESEHERWDRYGHPYSVLLTDIDRFKQVNDTHGHLTGDHVLREVARLLEGRVRRADVVARYGGEEFAILLPETGRRDALMVAEHLRRSVEDARLLDATTISIGVASIEQATMTTIPQLLVQAADEALYDAKRAGRNRVVNSSPLGHHDEGA